LKVAACPAVATLQVGVAKAEIACDIHATHPSRRRPRRHHQSLRGLCQCDAQLQFHFGACGPQAGLCQTARTFSTRTHLVHQQRAPALLTFLLCLLCLAFARPAATAATGIAVPIGGALKPDNHAVWSRLVELAGGRGRGMSCGNRLGRPAESAATIVSALNAHGARAGHWWFRCARRTRRPQPTTQSLAKVAASRGGTFRAARRRIVDTLVKPTVAPPMLAAIRNLFARGGVVSSAGAAVMSSTMFRDPPTISPSCKRSQGGT
jgi:hypothetical protein